MWSAVFRRGDWRFLFCCFFPLAVFAKDPGPEASEWIYRVQPGDSVWDISRNLLKDWRQWKHIVALNHIDNERTIPPGSLLRIPRQLVWEQPARILVQDVVGAVLRLPAGASQSVPLNVGDRVGAGDTVLTGSAATVMLHFEDKTRILLLENSELLIRAASVLSNKRDSVNIKVRLRRGEVEVDANPVKGTGSYFLIETPSAYATTRGTQYRVRSKAQQTAAEVVDGVIGVANGKGSVSVRQGFGVLVHHNEEPAPARRLLPAPELAAIHDPVRHLPKRIQWPSLPGAVAYRLQLATSDAFSSLVLDRTLSETATELPVQLADHRYALRLAGIDAQGLQGQWQLSALTVNARPFPPILSSPAARQRHYPGVVNFSWSRPENVAAFQFELAAEADFSQPLVDTVVEESRWEAALERPGRYFWRVRSVTAEGEYGLPSHVQTLTISPEPATPALTAPAIEDKRIHLSWGEGKNTISYQIQVAADDGFERILLDTETMEPRLGWDNPGGGYYFIRVRGVDEHGHAGGWSPDQHLEIPRDPTWVYFLTSVAAALLIL